VRDDVTVDPLRSIRSLLPRFPRRITVFGGVGAIGFAVDAGMLQALFLMGMAPLRARLISFPLAVTVTWLLNRRWTFRDRSAMGGRLGYPIYLLGQALGALLNMGVFVVSIHLRPTMAMHPIVPLAVGAAAGLAFNYLWSSLLVFRLRQSGTEGA
jgi:putative flippase GtrA